MLSGVPAEERLYSAGDGAASYSGVPSMAGVVSALWIRRVSGLTLG